MLKTIDINSDAFSLIQEGYQAFLDGENVDSNPYDKEAFPTCHMLWKQGWMQSTHFYNLTVK